MGFLMSCRYAVAPGAQWARHFEAVDIWRGPPRAGATQPKRPLWSPLDQIGCNWAPIKSQIISVLTIYTEINCTKINIGQKSAARLIPAPRESLRRVPPGRSEQLLSGGTHA